MDWIFFLKALHVVGFVSWFAGMFYLVRIFVYHQEAKSEQEPNRSVLTKHFQAMEWRAYKIICNPAMIITWVAGLGMLAVDALGIVQIGYFSSGTPGWLHLKLLLLILLSGYMGYCKKIIHKFEADEKVLSAWQFRLFNEVPTLFLLSISFIAVFGKTGRLNYGYLLLGVLLFGTMVYRGAVAYRKRRSAEE